MGSFAGLLGHAASGYMQEAQQDQQRQFEGEQNRRQQMIGLLGKLAGDETVHPDVRTWATQSMLEGIHTPYKQGKQWNPDFKNMPLSSGPPVPNQQSHVPTTPPMTMPGGPQLPGINPNAQLQGPPPPPPGIYNTPEQNTAMMAARTGAVTGAQGAAEAGPAIMQRGANGEINTVIPSKAPGQTFENTFSPMYGRMLNQDLYPVKILDANGQAQPAFQDRLGLFGPKGAVYDQNNQIIPNARVFEGALVGSQGTQIDPVTGLPTHVQTTKVPQRAGAPSAQPPAPSAVPAPPPSTIGASGQPEATQGLTGVPPIAAQAGPPAPPATAVAAPKKGSVPKPPAGTATAPTAKPAAVTAPEATNTIAGRSVPGQYYKQVSAMAKNMERNGEQPEGKFKGDVEAYMNENGMVPHTTQQVADYQKAFDMAMAQDNRFKMMDDLRKKVISDPSPENVGSYDAALIAYHMGMTVGQVKGMRSGKDMVMMHEHARSLPENVQTTIEGWINGSQLSPQQRQNFVDLAQQSRGQAWQEAVNQAKGMGFARFPRPLPGLPPVGFPPTLNRQQLDRVAKDHNETYGNARKQAVQQGLNVDDY